MLPVMVILTYLAVTGVNVSVIELVPVFVGTIVVHDEPAVEV